MRRAAGHALDAGPFAPSRFADAASGLGKRPVGMSLDRQGHASSSACKVAPSSAFLSSPEGRHSQLSYKHMFYLCSIAIRINGAPIEMTSLNRLTTMTVACLGMIAASSQQAHAQDFTLFEHAIVLPEAEPQPARQYLPAIYQAGPADVSYREGLYMAAIAEAERRYGLPTNLLRALIWAESRFNPMAVSPAGAAGLAQLMPATARELGVRNRHDPLASIDGGARYLRDMLNRFDAVHLALAAYNAGPGAVSRSRGIPNNGETPQYVRSVLGRWQAIGTYN